MKLLRPEGTITQGFGGNANSYYAEHQLMGHTGIDVKNKHGAPVFALYDGIVYKVFGKKNPTSDGMLGVFMLCNDPVIGWFEMAYFHLSEELVDEGDVIVQGQLLGLEGNTGTVYAGGLKVTCQAFGCKDGFHVHYQGRNIQRVQGHDTPDNYLTYGSGLYVDKAGYSYKVTNFNNGFNGCFNIATHFWTPTLVERLGMYWKVFENIKKLKEKYGY